MDMNAFFQSLERPRFETPGVQHGPREFDPQVSSHGQAEQDIMSSGQDGEQIDPRMMMELMAMLHSMMGRGGGMSGGR